MHAPFHTEIIFDSVANLDYDWPSPDRLASKNTYQPGCGSKAEVDCISNLEEVFCVLQKNAIEKSRLDMPGSSHWSAILLLIHIHSGASNDSYCQASANSVPCHVFAVYSSPIFEVYPAALLLSMSMPDEIMTNFQDWLQQTIVETSWNLPLPLCSWEDHVIGEIVHQVCTYMQWLAHSNMKHTHLQSLAFWKLSATFLKEMIDK